VIETIALGMESTFEQWLFLFPRMDFAENLLCPQPFF
jgi:hypothetical protein